jgi:DNA-3-methyladenine glycosylase
MRRRALLPRRFYVRPASAVARDLLGCVVETASPEGLVAVRLVETEAYAGEDDPASHAWRGSTPRSRIMFGPAGHAYVYFSYGMHWALNIVCEREGRASAVLLRAGEVVEGVDLATSRRRPGTATARLASGPANLAACLGIDGESNGLDVTTTASPVRVRRGMSACDDHVAVGPRIGISRAVDVPWRFRIVGDAHVSGDRRLNA